MFVNKFTLLLFIIFFLQDLNKKGFVISILKPLTIINLFLSVFFIIPMEVGLVFFSDYISVDFTTNFNKISYLIFFLAIILRFIDLRYSKFKVKNLESSKRIYNFSISFSILLYISFISILSIPLLFDVLNGNDLTSSAMKLRNGGAIKFFLLAFSESLPLIYLIYSKGKRGFVFYSITILSSLFIILLGARSLILSMILSILLYFLSQKLIKSKHVISFGMIFLIVFSLTSLNRSGGSDFFGYLSRNIDQLTNTAVVIEKIDSNEINYQYGGTLIDGIYFFIPSFIWNDKPKSYLPSRIVYPEMIKAGVESDTKYTMNFGMIGRSYLELGIFGVILINCIMLYFFNKIFYNIYNNLFNSKFKMFVSIFIYSHIHQFLIIGPTSHIYSIYAFHTFIFITIMLITNTFYKINTKG